MKLYLLQRKGDTPRWDVQEGCVVRAASPAAARKLAASTRGDEGEKVWTDPTRSSCEVLTAEGEAGTILTDFTSG